MFKVIRGAVHHKDTIYRQGAMLPDSFTNYEGYQHVIEVRAEKEINPKPVDDQFISKPKSKKSYK